MNPPAVWIHRGLPEREGDCGLCLLPQIPIVAQVRIGQDEAIGLCVLCDERVARFVEIVGPQPELHVRHVE